MANSRRHDAMTVWIGPEWAERRRRMRSLVALAAVTYSIAVSRPPGAGLSGRGLAVTLLLAVASLTWLYLIFVPVRRRIPADLGLLVIGAAGVALTIATPHSAAVVFVAVAIARSTRSWPPEWTISFGIALGVAYLVGHLAVDDSAVWLLTGPVVVILSLLVGSIRRQNDLLTTEVQIAREEHARSAALDERARIAREIHDVLAHSLAALSVQLETADALIESGRSEQAHLSVKRAGQLAKEGLAETRRAIGALRGDTLPLPELLTTLASGYQLDARAPATVDISGEPRTLRPDVSLTLYRTAQEAITNVRKHAPGAPVDVRLAYRRDDVALTVANGAARDEARPLADAGGGYGLTGLRERAELAGGTFDARPDGTGWRVDVRIPW
jgi:signal transduction histidine kinase